MEWIDLSSMLASPSRLTTHILNGSCFILVWLAKALAGTPCPLPHHLPCLSHLMISWLQSPDQTKMPPSSPLPPLPLHHLPHLLACCTHLLFKPMHPSTFPPPPMHAVESVMEKKMKKAKRWLSPLTSNSQCECCESNFLLSQNAVNYLWREYDSH